MSVSHSVYAVYGVVFEPPGDCGPLHAALEAQTPAAGGAVPESGPVHLFTIGDSQHLILGTACEVLEPNEYRPVNTLPCDPAWGSALLTLTRPLGLRVYAGPAWLLVHDLN
ncbi:hypothetical protein [Streptomyces sp. NPDC003483]